MSEASTHLFCLVHHLLMNALDSFKSGTQVGACADGGDGIGKTGLLFRV